MKRALAGVAVAFGVFAWAGVAVAENRRVVVAEPATIGIDEAYGSTFADLLRTELARQEGYEVVARAQTPPQPCGEAVCAPGVATAAGAHSAVVVTLSALGQKVIVKVEHVGSDGRVLYADRITAGTIEDLDPVSTRVAVAIATGKPLGETETVSTVTSQEARAPVRKQSLFTTGLRLGALVPIADSYGGATAAADVGFFGMFEIERIAAVIEADFLFPADSDTEVKIVGLFFGLGGRYFLDAESPTGTFVGGGFGYRILDVERQGMVVTESDDRGGVGGYLTAGVVFLRTSDVHIVLDARYDANFFELGDLSEGQGGHSLMIGVGLSYSKWGMGRRWWW